MTPSPNVSFHAAAPVLVVHAGVERDHVLIHLQAASETKRPPGQSAVNVFVTDVDALYQELKARGARTLNEPKDYPYGMRDFDQLCFGMESHSAQRGRT